jgi:hypothetical protein
VAANADLLASFVSGLPDGDRHKGTFWALNVAVENHLPDGEVRKVAAAAVAAGLDEEYVDRTLRQIRAKDE